MEEKELTTHYDYEEDILHVAKPQKVKASLDIGDFIVDINHQGLVVGVEILEASTHVQIPREKLRQAKQAKLHTTYKQSAVYVHLTLHIDNKEKTITIPFSHSKYSFTEEMEV